MSHLSKKSKEYICDFCHDYSADFYSCIVKDKGGQDDRGHGNREKHVGVPYQEPTVDDAPVEDLVHGQCLLKREELSLYCSTHHFLSSFC